MNHEMFVPALGRSEWKMMDYSLLVLNGGQRDRPFHFWTGNFLIRKNRALKCLAVNGWSFQNRTNGADLYRASDTPDVEVRLQ
jgi:hypothetical protein